MRIYVPVSLASLTLAASVRAAPMQLADWTFETNKPTLSVGQSPPSLAADTGAGTATAFHSNASTSFNSVQGNGSATAWTANDWGVGDYYQFSVSTLGFSDVQLSVDQIGSSTGPKGFDVQYSVDNITYFTATSYSVGTATWTTGSTDTTNRHTFDLTAFTSLDNAATIYLRLVDNSTTSIGGGTVAGTGTDRVDNVIVSASALPAATPLPTAAWAGLTLLPLLALRTRRRAQVPV